MAAAPGLPSGYDVLRVDSPNPTVGGDFGIGFVSAGDVTGDGKDDLLVGTDEHGGSDGQVYVMSGADGTPIRTINNPDPTGTGTKNSFGSYVGKLTDIGSCPGFSGNPGETCTLATIGAPDGVPDAAISALGVDVGADADIGRVYVVDGATGAVLKRIDMPAADRTFETGIPAKPAFGRTVLNPIGQPPCDGFGGIGPCAYAASSPVARGDLDGGGQPDIVVGASDFYDTIASNPACNPGPCLQAGRAYVYRGEDIAGTDPAVIDDTPWKVIKNPLAQTDDPDNPVNVNRESMGYSVAPIGDIGKCNTDPGPGGTCVNANSTATPDGKPDWVLSDHRVDEFGMFDVGAALLIDGPTESVLATYHHPEPQPASLFAFSNYNQPAPGNMGSGTNPDSYQAAMRQNNPFTGGGRGYAMNGNFKQSGSPNSISFASYSDPTPHPSEDFGTSSAGVGNVYDDPFCLSCNEMLIGAYGPHNPGTNPSTINDVHIFDTITETSLQDIPAPDQQPGLGFGTALAPLGDLNGDGFLDFAVGAGLYDLTTPGGPLADAGRIYIFSSDNVPPDTQIDSGPSDPTNNPDATFTFSSPDAGATFECSLDGFAFEECASPTTYQDLADGQHTFQVQAVDQAGNPDPAPAEWTWTIDTVRPTSAVVRPADNGSYPQGTPKSAKGTASDDRSGVSLVQVALRRTMTDGSCRWWNGSAFAPGTCGAKVWNSATGTATWTFSLPALPRSVGTTTKIYDLYSRARDSAGNNELGFARGRNWSRFEVT
jgi:hypothetical protein